MAPRPPPAHSRSAQIAKQHQTASETHRRGGVEEAERRAVRPSWVLSSQLAQSKPLRTEQCKLRNPSPLVRRGLIERGGELLCGMWLLISLSMRQDQPRIFVGTPSRSWDRPASVHGQLDGSCQAKQSLQMADLGALSEDGP